eukprot:NODE_25_length_41203_cov_0.917113.p8 type:complete len:507 gc:universal NODE_25_length_41203_cov_0.917113:11019-9499(-)
MFLIFFSPSMTNISPNYFEIPDLGKMVIPADQPLENFFKNTPKSSLITHIQNISLEVLLDYCCQQSSDEVKIAAPTLNYLNPELLKKAKVVVADPYGSLFKAHRPNFEPSEIESQFEKLHKINGETRLFPFAFYRGLYIFENIIVVEHFQFGRPSSKSPLTLLKTGEESTTSEQFYKQNIDDIHAEFNKIWEASEEYYSQEVQILKTIGFNHDASNQISQSYDPQLHNSLFDTVVEYIKYLKQEDGPNEHDSELLGISNDIVNAVLKDLEYEAEYPTNHTLSAYEFYGERLQMSFSDIVKSTNENTSTPSRTKTSEIQVRGGKIPTDQSPYVKQFSELVNKFEEIGCMLVYHSTESNGGRFDTDGMPTTRKFDLSGHDSGAGIYLNETQEQAIDWVLKRLFRAVNRSGCAYIYVYRVACNALPACMDDTKWKRVINYHRNTHTFDEVNIQMEPLVRGDTAKSERVGPREYGYTNLLSFQKNQIRVNSCTEFRKKFTCVETITFRRI